MSLTVAKPGPRPLLLATMLKALFYVLLVAIFGPIVVDLIVKAISPVFKLMGTIFGSRGDYTTGAGGGEPQELHYLIDESDHPTISSQTILDEINGLGGDR